MTQRTDALHVRDGKREDLPHVANMVRALAEHHGDRAKTDVSVLTRDFFGPTPWGHLLVAEITTELVGYAALCPVIRLHEGLRGMELHHLFVRRAFRGRGVGQALIGSAERTALGFHCVSLNVGAHPENRRAQNTYLSQGFEKRSRPTVRFRKGLEPSEQS
ncbi:MAG: GNAT family N-acetyltransferase [Pseudomonadota bacterium]